MASKNSSVFGVYQDRQAVDEAIDDLRAAGFRSTDISVLIQENEGTKDLAHQKNTKAPEGAAAGGIASGAVGGVLGGLIGAGLLAIPGLDPLVVAGPIVAALAGAGALGALGCIIGGLAGLGVPEYEAKRYEGRTKQGGVLMSVHCDNNDWVSRARNLLHQTGAEDIGRAGESAADFQVSDRPKPRMRRANTADPLSGPE
jgi:predicted lipid-binding transport protein (Tim44 family)